ncbi:SDR family NAD(P)-dependent oxidoreductase [Ferrimonas pelagia]|uniref:SDR family NAD(P)-dependent oxidoreductase n=1 Tax=Ferrimonas pelagia TaxID=1177826 RepID=A0ABP9EU72_9GAMM
MQVNGDPTPKTILLTGATDGIGLVTARQLVGAGHKLLLHGRNPEKLARVASELNGLAGAQPVECYEADLSQMTAVEALAKVVSQRHAHLNVVINNAGVFSTPHTTTAEGLDVRFAVNALAPYLLTLRLMPLLGECSRVVNLSSAAQAPVELEALKGNKALSASAAYAQSKLAMTMWTRSVALGVGDSGPILVAVNPASMLGSKMVKDAYGVAGGDLSIGADILCRAALSEEFENASGKYFDNDSGQFRPPHPDGLNDAKCLALIDTLDAMLAQLT